MGAGAGDGFGMMEIGVEFFERDPVSCARELIGCRFSWNGCVGRIVETEAYDSVDDPACHTWFRPSTRAFVEAQSAGDAYVYLNYGVHWLFNVLVKGGDRSGFVLFRALEPVAGTERMRERRAGVKDPLLGAGPGRLTRAFGIDGSAHGVGFLHARHLRHHGGCSGGGRRRAPNRDFPGEGSALEIRRSGFAVVEPEVLISLLPQ